MKKTNHERKNNNLCISLLSVVVMTVQDRAYTSPIWYTPGA